MELPVDTAAEVSALKERWKGVSTAVRMDICFWQCAFVVLVQQHLQLAILLSQTLDIRNDISPLIESLHVPKCALSIRAPSCPKRMLSNVVRTRTARRATSA